MENEIHMAAEAFRAAILAENEMCGDIVHSINRHCEASSYFAALGSRIRVSDHHANEFFRVNEISVFYKSATCNLARSMVADYREARRATKERRDAEIAARDAFEAPFIARFRAATKDHEREAIMREAYPTLFGPGRGKQDRGQFLQRFRG